MAFKLLNSKNEREDQSGAECDHAQMGPDDERG